MIEENVIDNDKEITFINPYEYLDLKNEEENIKYYLDKVHRHVYGDSMFTDKYEKLKKLNPSNKKKLLLSYYMIFNLDKFESFKKEYFHIKKKDHFYYVIIGDLENLKKLYEVDKYIIETKDNYYRNLLHYAVLGEYYDICEFLLKEGINYDEPDYYSETALYNAKGKIKDLLKKYGAKKTVYNTCIFDSINVKYNEEDKIGKIYNFLYNCSSIKKINSIYSSDGKKIIGKRMIRTKINNETNNWINTYHGTKYISIQHIANFGLRNYGEPLIGHIQKNETINDIKNWSSAIFVSPSILYAKNYSEVIGSNGDNWYIIIEAKIEPGYYSSHESTIYNYNYKSGEPRNVEYRIESTDNIDDCFVYGGPDQNHISTTSILFVKKDFLDNLNNYQDTAVFKY